MSIARVSGEFLGLRPKRVYENLKNLLSENKNVLFCHAGEHLLLPTFHMMPQISLSEVTKESVFSEFLWF